MRISNGEMKSVSAAANERCRKLADIGGGMRVVAMNGLLEEFASI